MLSTPLSSISLLFLSNIGHWTQPLLTIRPYTMSPPSATEVESLTLESLIVAAPVKLAVKESSTINALSQGGYVLPGIPTFTDFESHRQWIREHMAAAFRAMGRQGLAEGLAGHISVRDPEHSDRFWMNPFVSLLFPCNLRY
jgi:hypothetical protein